jgi:UbiD family decarboxylase
MSNDRLYPDLHDHIKKLEEAGLLITVDEPIDKDSEMHSLVRWQFVGGLKESERKAFLFRSVTNAKGRKYELPIVVGALAANQDIYSVGMGVPVDEIGKRWEHAIANPIEPVIVQDAPCHEVIIEGEDLLGEGNGLDALPIPVSTPGFDAAPTLTSTNVVTRDPETGVQNMGTYRAAFKAPDRLVVRMATRVGGAGGYQHYKKHRARGDKEMPVAIVLGFHGAAETADRYGRGRGRRWAGRGADQYGQGADVGFNDPGGIGTGDRRHHRYRNARARRTIWRKPRPCRA